MVYYNKAYKQKNCRYSMNYELSCTKKDNMFFETEKKANQLRMDTLEMCLKAGTGHVTSCMSCADILATLYHGEILDHDPKNPQSEERDSFILSKGQASPILYAALADRGYFPKSWMSKFAKGTDGTGKNAPFGVHLQCTVPGVEFTTGSLGYGLGYGTGMAEAIKLNGKSNKVFVLLGDGELYEGANWEAAMYASHHQLNNLIAIVDRNSMCTNNYTEQIVKLEPLRDKWESFGWDVSKVNGHSVKDLSDALVEAKYSAILRPHVIIAETIKGRGISSMTGKLYLHGVTPSGENAKIAKKDLKDFSKRHIKEGGYNE